MADTHQDDYRNAYQNQDTDRQHAKDTDRQEADTISLSTVSEPEAEDVAAEDVATEEAMPMGDAAPAARVPLYTKHQVTDDSEIDARGNRILRRQGASTPTIVLGSMLVVVGIVAVMIAGQYPQSLFASVGWNWPVVLAVALAAVGAVLLLSSLFWTISAIVRRIAR
ncbi:hypothetical protein [Bifidobacterium crudilactis]|jgi:hypothetical protein|uniref:hypothetical protein n=1 Tax=Bifidobacterium crudilactis TaxID=327277 RepID=UPI0023577D09|nr:hypothetical protein [Bifidobacterium crudilactis]MCI1218063.1 hypothetical protein [Bifidobacterium crudilactis]